MGHGCLESGGRNRHPPVTAPSAQASHSPMLEAGPIDTPVPVWTDSRPASSTAAIAASTSAGSTLQRCATTAGVNGSTSRRRCSTDPAWAQPAR